MMALTRLYTRIFRELVQNDKNSGGGKKRKKEKIPTSGTKDKISSPANN
jgi:hypothetical protein